MFLDQAVNLTGIKSYKNIYEDVYVDVKTGAVLDANLEPIYETFYEIIFWWQSTLSGENIVDPEKRKLEVQRRYESICKELDTIDQQDIDQARVLNERFQVIYAMSAQGWYPYGHLHDALLRLYPWRDHNFDNPKVLCSTNINRVVDFNEHIEAFGYREDQIYRQKLSCRLVKISKLYYGVNETSYWTTSTREQYDWMKSGYMSLLSAEERSKPMINGLYLSRNHVGRRGVINNDEVSSFLTEKGFNILSGKECLKDIISLFYRAKVIVGPHGSIFVNAIFCDNRTKIIEFCPNNRQDFSFYRKTKDASDYNHVLVNADEDYNIYIDIRELEKML